ncbi:hypothetical protein A3B02_02240 [Candidatus Roizmanbacteria bacterium RIFCSPLOWO2_01_FULL_42_14]|uniref:AB hydrolase-1 domain-containing protein n=3 Tax=Candidatus Roizmaniibacteriota TaxID=1752723 RepID=A0A1F7JXE8_9BACT|nr:MAG: hypothetical protein A3D08_01155 [Candidatus Roizmanbacteria bacterium RIFCSPHIGHO2_02_FULL_43_11]OGK51942.1 MAG: hypothetical protein A3B02_02240 [Candidatus Roizmanbacteria bacterium RIFCSPLOWO2_01_FULL_42_14]OGK60291.1 MAG: hypothetical protein A3I56_04335 [Candidatus Roizmanbacteria bacterium RIFCSPLOWO2_02_FULL_43_10]
MIDRRPFTLQESPVSGEIHGDPASKKVVVLSHGFGVFRDSRGMYTELAERLGQDRLVVLFDYVDVDEAGDTTVRPLTEQSAMLNAVLRHVRETYNVKELSIVAHSQGCLVVGLSNPDNVDKVVLNASPMAAPSQARMQETFGSREGTHIVSDGISTIKRSDGKLTYIPPEFWAETAGIHPIELYARLAERTNVYIVQAMQDHVLPNQDYSALRDIEGITYIELDGNHDFAGDAREGWLNLMVQLIEGK